MTGMTSIALWMTMGFAIAQPSATATKSTANTLRLAKGAAPPAASIGQLSWLSGNWEGEGLGGVSRELWAPPLADRMYGIFTLEKEGAVVFSETLLLIEESGTVSLKLKHFNPDFTGWEDKDGFVTFPLVRLGDHEAYFSGLTFRRQGESLSIYLVLSEDDVRTEHEFRLRRVPL